MIQGKSVIAIIPARGGSKGLPGKNKKKIAGKPLVAWAIECALKSKYIDRVVVSTDSQEIARVAKRYGADVPFLRPKKLAGDRAPHSAAVLHALDYLKEEGTSYDFTALLEPTSPLRRTKDIDGGIQTLAKNLTAHSVVSVCPVEGQHPEFVFKLSSKGFIRRYLGGGKVKLLMRQELSKLYYPEGTFYILNNKYYRKVKSQYSEKTIAYPVKRYQALEIDELSDFIAIEAILSYLKKNPKVVL